MNTIEIPKDNAYNYSYFSFDNGGSIVPLEPPKTTWDIVFTSYRHYFADLRMLYIVRGVLHNSYRTVSLADSTTGFENITHGQVRGKVFSIHRNIIGFDWKDYIRTQDKYIVKPINSYVVRTQKINTGRFISQASMTVTG